MDHAHPVDPLHRQVEALIEGRAICGDRIDLVGGVFRSDLAVRTPAVGDERDDHHVPLAPQPTCTALA